jgi:hypothetical protein
MTPVIMRRQLAAVLAATCLPFAASAQENAGHDHGHHQMKAAPASMGGCDGPELACGLVANPVFDNRHRLWMIWTAQSKVWVAHQEAPGGPLGAAVAVTPEPVRLDTGPDSRAKLAIDGTGRISVAFAIVPEGSWNGQIFTAASADDGKTFSVPRRLDAQSPGHRFEALQVLPDGRLLAATIDKVNAVLAKKAGGKYAGAALALAWSGDGGLTFTPAKAVVDQSCECCRMGIALDGKGQAVIAFRNIFGGTTRDHAVITVAADGTAGPVRRVSNDEWVTDTCPHQGPALAISASGAQHVVWYTAGNTRKGVFYARAPSEAAAFSGPLALGRTGVQVSRPQVLADGNRVYLAWKEFDGATTSAVAQTSLDDGVTWSAPAVLATTQGRADHPQLAGDRRGAVFLSWLTDGEGHRLLPIGSGS